MGIKGSRAYVNVAGWTRGGGRLVTKGGRFCAARVARIYTILLVGVSIGVGIALWPHAIRTSSHPSIPDQIFQSRALVVTIRVGVLFAIGFIVASLLARIWNSQWLTRAGPFEVGEVVDLTDELEELEDELDGSYNQIEALQNRIKGSQRMIADYRSAARDAYRQVERLTGDLDQAHISISDLRKQLNTSERKVEELAALLKQAADAPKTAEEGDSEQVAEN